MYSIQIPAGAWWLYSIIPTAYLSASRILRLRFRSSMCPAMHHPGCTRAVDLFERHAMILRFILNSGQHDEYRDEHWYCSTISKALNPFSESRENGIQRAWNILGLPCLDTFQDNSERFATFPRRFKTT